MPDKIPIPFPVLSIVPLPLITPLNVNWVPSTSRSVFPFKVIGPANVLVPVEAEIIPELLITLSVVEYVTFWKSNVAPDEILVWLPLSPNALLLPIANVPADTVTAPEKVLFPERVKVPVPCLTIPPVPKPAPLLWITPEKVVEVLSPPTVNTVLCSTSIVPPPAIEPIVSSL